MSQLVKAAFKLACSAGVFIGRARMVLIAPIFLCHRIKDGGFIVAIRLTSFRPPKIRLHCRLLSNGKLPVYCTDNQILSYPHITSFDFEFFFKPEAKNIPIQATNGAYCPITQTRWVLCYYTVLLMLKSWQLIANQIRKLVSCIQWNLSFGTPLFKGQLH